MSLNVPVRIVVMGVSGCGKSTVARALAERLALSFVEADELHPPRNVAVMAAGTPLTDDDRCGWLHAVAVALGLRLVHLTGPQSLLAERLRSRAGHYMPVSLLQSQIDTLEPPAADEGALTQDIGQAPERIVDALCQQLENIPA